MDVERANHVITVGDRSTTWTLFPPYLAPARTFTVTAFTPEQVLLEAHPARYEKVFDAEASIESGGPGAECAGLGASSIVAGTTVALPIHLPPQCREGLVASLYFQDNPLDTIPGCPPSGMCWVSGAGMQVHIPLP